MELLMRRTLRGLEPLDDTALKGVPLGDVVRVKFARVRSGPRHRLFFAFVGMIHANLPTELAAKYPTRELLLEAFKVLTGHAEMFWLPDGRQVVRGKSIAFSAMDETAFGQFMDRCFAIAAEHLIPGIRRDDVRAELESITGIK